MSKSVEMLRLRYADAASALAAFRQVEYLPVTAPEDFESVEVDLCDPGLSFTGTRAALDQLRRLEPPVRRA